jgi:outer membrane protein
MAYGQAAQAPAPAPPLAAGAAAPSPAPTATPNKVAIIALQKAVVSTKDGEKASADMQAKFGAEKAELEKRAADLQSKQDQLNKGAATMSEAAKQSLAADITNGQKKLQRDGQDFDEKVQEYENKLMQDLATKMMDVVIKYASTNGYAMVVDVSNQQSPILWADQATVITDTIVKLYDQAHPVAAVAATPTAAPKAPATPPAKKQ